MRILLVEDDEDLRESVTTFLRASGFAVDAVATGKMAREQAAVSPFDAIVLDVQLPDTNGFAVCRALRASGVTARVLMATARDAVEDRIAGLDGGADDYIVKPYALGELVARLRALLRRPAEAHPVQLRVDDLTLDPATRVARRGTREITLTTKEFAVLEVLMRGAGHVITRERLSQHAWDDNFDPSSNVIDVYIARLRRKIDHDADRPLLETVRGAGYRLGAAAGARDVRHAR
jgi:DNA-binding response OmpR family regulator